MEEKQKTLRPEIQLLNNLMAATDDAQQTQVCSDSTLAQLSSSRNAVKIHAEFDISFLQGFE